MGRELLVLIQQEFQSAAQGSEHVLIPSPWHGATAPGPAAGGGAGCFYSQADFIAKTELFSHHKSLRTAQLFLWWTPQGTGFAALPFSPLNLGGSPFLCLVPMKSKDFSTQPLFCCECSPLECQTHMGSKPLELISLRDLKCQISANLK